MSVSSIINGPKQVMTVTIRVLNNPLSHCWEILFLEKTKEVIRLDIGERCKNPSVNLSTAGVTLTLIEDTSPVREMFLNQRRQNLRFERDPFFCEDFLDSFEELWRGTVCLFRG